MAQHTSASAEKRFLPWLVSVAFFMEALDTTILNTATPVVAHSLGVTVLDMKAVMASYTMSLALFIPVSGWVADRFGTRRVFAFAIALFTVASLLCGCTGDLNSLVVFRVLQGCGGAMMMPVGRLILVRAFSKYDLVRAMSFVAIPGMVGPMLGPAVGGLIIHYFSWRVIFFLNIPVGALGVMAALRWLPDFRQAPRPLDVPGLLLFGASIGLLSYVLEILGDHGLTANQAFLLICIALASLLAYGFHATRTQWPLLDLRLFRTASFAVAVGGGFLTRIGIGGVPFLLPLLYQEGLGLSPLQSGLLITPQALASLSVKAIVPTLLRKGGYRLVLTVNTLIMGAMLAAFATVDRMTPIWLIVLQTLVYGALTSAQHASMNTLVYADVPSGMSSNASSIAGTAQQLSNSFGVAAAGIMTFLFISDRMHTTRNEFTVGLHDAFLALGLFTIASTAVFACLRSGPSLQAGPAGDPAALSQETVV